MSYPVEHSTVARRQRDLWAAAGRQERIVATVAETAALATFVASALGIAVVPRGVEKVRIPGVVYIPLEPPLVLPLLVAVRDDEEAVASRVTEVVMTLG